MKRAVDTPRKHFKKEIEVIQMQADDYEVCNSCSRDLTESFYKINLLSSLDGNSNERPMLLCKNCFDVLLNMMSEVRKGCT